MRWLAVSIKNRGFIKGKEDGVMKLGFLGPAGTFSETGALMYTKGKEGYELCPIESIAEVLHKVETGEIDEGIVPFENSIEGTVTASIDTLIFDVDLFIKAEVIVPVCQSLYIKKEFQNEKVTKILSHPHALAQCRKYIKANYPDSIIEPASSTAASAKIAAESEYPVAGIGMRRAAELYGLHVLADDIQDEDGNATRFVVVTKKEPMLTPGTQKTSIAFSTKNQPGELSRVLDIFFHFDINMTKIESRPIRRELGTYIFFVDLETANCQDMRDALTMVRRKSAHFKYMGAYPVYA